MLSAWVMASAASGVAALFAASAALAMRRTMRADAASRAATLRAALLADALTRRAHGAVRQTAAGARIVVGTVPTPVIAAIDKALGRGRPDDDPIVEAVRRLVDEGRLFRFTFTDEQGPLVLDGTLEGGHLTVFVLPAAVGLGAVDAGLVPQRLHALLAGAPHPAWVATESGERVWANRAYAKAVGALDGDAATSEPLLDTNALRTLPIDAQTAVSKRVQTVVNGQRRVLDVAADKREGTLAAVAVDVTEADRALTAQTRALESHALTFDQLATAIAIFGPDRRLTFHNAAFQRLWGLSPAFLDTAPAEEHVLDKLRADRRLPETADFRAWKRDQLMGYQTREAFERWWHLPDGQTLRVIANPGADGGVTYIYENVTEQLALERQFNAISRVQAETIDNLSEGVATFGPDGLLRLANPSFFELTRTTPAVVGDHVRAIAGTAPTDEAHAWAVLIERVTGLSDHRTAATGRLERDGQVIEYAFTPLPDGATLATFGDVTDTVNVARALTERNNALVAADRLKNAFIEHISYELRSPLTTIIGFTQLLTRPATGELSPRQREYADYISSTSEALLVIIDGILDLATIDAGIMELSLAPVDVEDAARQVLVALKDRISETRLRVDIVVDPDAATFEGDPLRVRQALYNLISNAINHSPDGALVTIRAVREGDRVAIAVRDRGPGIPPEKAETIFERFSGVGGPSAAGRRRQGGGVGLGLSLVKSFVELHGGTVAVAQVDGPGAELVMRFPLTVGEGAGEARRAA